MTKIKDEQGNFVDFFLWRKYRKKPVVINVVKTEQVVFIETLEGTMRADPGDYIIKGVNGELYPCKPDIFAKTYELVD